MAESAVTFLLDKLTYLSDNDQVELSRGVRGELECIRGELMRMKAFTGAASAVEASDPQLKSLSKKVRDVAYDTEDMLDEFMLELRDDHGDNMFCGLQHMIASYPKNVRARLQLASRVQAIKSRISGILERYQSYGFRATTQPILDNKLLDRRGDALLLEEAELVGIEKPKNQLVGWLVEDDHVLKVVSVVGMGGLGKTTLLKKVYDDAKVKNHFDHRAWIQVSQSFKIEELLRDMMYQLFNGVNKQAPQGMEAMSSVRLKTTTKEFLQESRYLLVLDDIWGKDAWDAVKHVLPNNNHGSRVLLTTRNAEVASTTGVEYKSLVYYLNPLSQEESWTLFCRKTFQEDSCPPHLKEISQQILRQCGGLPIAIVAVSGMLAIKDCSRIDEWEKLARNLGSEIEANDGLQSMSKILLLGYYDLPYYLKSCFLYLSIFPEDYSIECMRLIRLWMAEGFVEGSFEEAPEDLAETYLNDLLARGLIQVAGRTSDGRIHSCRIHSFVREIILSKCREQNFTTIASEQDTIWPEKVRRLSIHGKLGNIIANKGVSKLRSLLAFGVEDSLSEASMPSLFAGDLNLLTVLDLRGTHLKLVPDGLFNLVRLKYFSLRDTKVKILPSSIGKLLILQTLDLKRTSISQLPVEILKLQQLRHLLLYRFEMKSYMPYPYLNGFKAPNGIGGLQSLQKLSFVESDEGGFMVEQLAMLCQLRRLGITNLRREQGMRFCSSIEKLTNLRSLNVHAVEEDEIIDLQNLFSPPKFLQRLYLHGCLEQLPSWISSLNSLVKLYLRWSHLGSNLLDSLGVMPNLVELQLRQAYDGQKLSFKAGRLPRLKILLLDELEQLRYLTVEKGAIPLLEELTISRCQFLEEESSGLEHLENLKTVKFFDMPDELRRMIERKKEKEEPWNLSHVPQVLFIRSRNSHWERIILSARTPNKTEKQ